MAQLFRMDPSRDLDPNLDVVASYLRADDVFIDVGGGAGRVGPPGATLPRGRHRGTFAGDGRRVRRYS